MITASSSVNGSCRNICNTPSSNFAFLLLAVVIFLALTQLGCHGQGLCLDPCPNPKERRDLFCNCFEPKTTVESKLPPTQSQGSTLQSDCVCAYPATTNKVEAWFISQPPGFDTLRRGTTVRIYVPTDREGNPLCKNLSVCPIVGPKHEQTILGGNLDIEVESATRHDNKWGKTSYSILGTRLSGGILKKNMSSSLFKNNLLSTPLPTEKLHLSFFQTNKKIDSCINVCGHGFTDKDCMQSKINLEYQSAMGELLNRANTGETVITPDDLVKSFRLGGDPCDRGPTAISLFGVSNTGPPCRLEIEASQLDLRIRIEIPARLAGSWQVRSLSHLKLVFDETKFAPSLRFMKLKSEEPSKLDSAFGGLVEFAEADKQRFFLKTKGGRCVGIQTIAR